MVNLLYWTYVICAAMSVLIFLLIIIRGLYYMKYKFPYRVRPEFHNGNKKHEKTIPAISVFVPCKGVFPELDKNIKAMLNQDYPNYKLFFITEIEDDTAASILQSDAIKKAKNFYHVIAGHTSHCCQKNNNLLKGIDYANNKNLAGEIYVFADADIRPSKSWLSNIILPLTDQSVFAVSGFRSLVPDRNSFAEHTHSAFSALQCLAMTENKYAAMWGGSMAISRKAFEEYAIYKKWSNAVVDDLSLTSIIKKYNLKRVFSPDCLVDSRESYSRLSKVLSWFIRQNQYAAAYLRLYTALGIILNSILMLDVFMLPVSIALVLSHFTSWGFAEYNLVLYIMISTCLSLLSCFRKQKGYELIWFLYSPCFLMLGLYCSFVGFLSKRIVWADIVYHMNKRGNVLLVER